MDGDQVGLGVHLPQPGLDRVDALLSAHNHLAHLVQVELPAQPAHIHHQVLPGHYNDLVNHRAVLKGVEGMDQYRQLPQGGQHLVNAPHPPGQPRGYDHR